ncbi:MAG TPA: 2-amino-4-hydroxy-6-hydroxymethyldihydropteridine diphosphokinase [Actinomycetota bacterium]|jgi:2-amino-4-hydroxy-6-hydroxymethyldihydropteridine diphosphokinase|nr:2-amino-4-hydroxy-6-hydroxymethyldihydropteridine diphosphokinase [Actinomycetota bacterium]
MGKPVGMVTGFIGIGSNVGTRESFVRRAVDELDSTEGITVTGRSSLYETSPIGGPPQRSFINAVVRVETTLPARALYDACKRIERRIGREPSELRWGPRVVDLDLLLHGDEKIVEPDLEIPHPRMGERRFVLVPLLEVEPDVRDPWGSPYADLLDEAEGTAERVGAL